MNNACTSVDSLDNIGPNKVKAQNSISTSVNSIVGQWCTHACMPVSMVRFVNIYYNLTCFLSITILPTFSEKCHSASFFCFCKGRQFNNIIHIKYIHIHTK